MSEEDAQGSTGSLSKTFNKLSHWHHIFMMTSMALMSISMAVASAGTSVAVLDPFIAYGKMLFSGFTGMADVVEFVPDAFENLTEDGALLSGADMGMDHMHGGGGGHDMADMHGDNGFNTAGSGHENSFNEHAGHSESPSELTTEEQNSVQQQMMELGQG